MICAPSEDSDQPGHPPSLIRVFAVRMKKAMVQSYPLSAHRWRMAKADLSFCWVHIHFVGCVVRRLILIVALHGDHFTCFLQPEGALYLYKSDVYYEVPMRSNGVHSFVWPCTCSFALRSCVVAFDHILWWPESQALIREPGNGVTVLFCSYLTSLQYNRRRKSRITHMSHDMTKQSTWHVRPAKTQISLGIHPV